MGRLQLQASVESCLAADFPCYTLKQRGVVVDEYRHGQVLVRWQSDYSEEWPRKANAIEKVLKDSGFQVSRLPDDFTQLIVRS